MPGAITAHPTRPGELLLARGAVTTYSSLDFASSWTFGSTIALEYEGSYTDFAMGMGGDYGYIRSHELVRSHDRGATWTPIQWTGVDNVYTLLGVEPQLGVKLVALGQDSLLLSFDAGESFRVSKPAPFGVRGVVDWSIGRAYMIGNGATVVSSTIDGATEWISGPSPATLVAAAGGKALATTFPLGLQHSPDGGATWIPASGVAARSFGAIAYSPTHPDIAFAVERFQGKFEPYVVYRSNDGGATFAPVGQIAEGADAGTFQTLVVGAGSPPALLLSSVEGMWRSLDGGASWALVPRQTRMPGLATLRVIFDATNPQARWVRASSPHVRTTDGGATWSRIGDFGSGINRAVAVIAASTTHSGVVYGTEGGVFNMTSLLRSTNGGVQWTSVLNPGPIVGLLPGASANDVFVFARSGNLWRSADDGATWTAIGTMGRALWWIDRTMTDSLTFYAVAEAATNQGGLYRSTDQGASWQPVTTTGLDGNLWSIFVAPSNSNRLYAGVTIANAHDTSYQDFIYRSDDAGATWTRVWTAMPDAYLWDLVIDPANSARIVAATKTNGTEATGVYLSSDAGASWSGLDEGLDDRSIDDLALDPLNPGILYASTPSGVFRADLADPPAGNRWAIEYHHSRFNHYFVTADPDEIAALDAGAFEGWARTHATFRVAPATPPESPTCRFFGVGFGPLSSHFYTPYPDECATVKLDPKWVYEKLAFGLRLPNAQSGCVPGTVPLYRAWNRNRDGAPNHRYATDWPTFKAMLADGWQFEGELSTKVFACVPL